ncbi:MAG TPA: VirB8/TrbF family protein [Sphingobium sp.]
MSEQPDHDLPTYLQAAESWATDREASQRARLRTAWIIAAVATVIAIAEAIAIVALTPLKTVVPYTLLVDRQTGYVQALKPLEQEMVAPDKALTRSLLAQYVIAREGFDIDSLKDDYRRVALWSTGTARNRYIADMQASNPASPLATLPRRAIIEVEIRGLSSLGPQTSLVRFATVRTDQGAQQRQGRTWQAVVTYRFSGSGMSTADRLVNPLGFQVTRYRRDAEIVPVQDTAPVPEMPRALPGSPLAASPLPTTPLGIGPAGSPPRAERQNRP